MDLNTRTRIAPSPIPPLHQDWAWLHHPPRYSIDMSFLRGQDPRVAHTMRSWPYARRSIAKVKKASWGDRPRESEPYRLLVSRAATQRLCEVGLEEGGEMVVGGVDGAEEEAEEEWVRNDRIVAKERVRRVLAEIGVSWGKLALSDGLLLVVAALNTDNSLCRAVQS